MMTFTDMLDNCCDRNSARHNEAWREFMLRYKQFIYYNALRRCQEWNLPRIGLQLNDIVNDVVAEVFRILCTGEFSALRKFQARDSEKKFRWYLITTCHRATSRHVQRYLSRYADADPAVLQQLHQHMPGDTHAQLFELLVDSLMQAGKRTRSNQARDIQIFLLYTWSDFDADMIAACPCLKGIGHRVVDNVVHRLRTHLRETMVQL